MVVAARASKALSAAGVAQVPVGLFGLAMNTSRVEGVIAAAIAARSWPSGIELCMPSAGTSIGCAPVSRVTSP